MTDLVKLSETGLGWLMALLSVPSVSPLEEGDPVQADHAQQVVEEGALRRGFVRIRRDSPPPSILGRADVPVSLRSTVADRAGFLAAQPSLVMALGRPQPPERRLVINFHVDTVGPHVPPRLDGRRLHGRGVIDDKGPGVAAAVGAAAAFEAAPWLADHIEVQLASVPGEEGGAMGVYGTRWLVESGCTGRLMLFTEPTGCRVLDASSATMTPVLKVEGSDATDDHPGDGHNATLALGFLATYLGRELGRHADSLQAKVCVAGLRTGTMHNRVYGTGELHLNIAYYNSETAGQLFSAVEQLVAEAGTRFAEDFGEIGIARRLAVDWRSVVRLHWLKRGLPALSNRDPEMEALLTACGLPRADGIADGTAFTCDAIWAGGPGRYVAICGPGWLHRNGAHTPGEYVDLDDLDAYATRVRDLVLRFYAHVTEQRAETSP